MACKIIGWRDVEDPSGFAGSADRSWKCPLQAFEAAGSWPAAWPVAAGQLEDAADAAVVAAAAAGKTESLRLTAGKERQVWKVPL